MSDAKLIRIMFADDHPLVREGLASIIGKQSDMLVVAEASDGVQAIELFRLHTPDITLMDLRLPGMSGLEAITAIRRARSPKASLKPTP